MSTEFLRAFESATITDAKLRTAMGRLADVAFIATQATAGGERDALEKSLIAAADALVVLFASPAAPRELTWV